MELARVEGPMVPFRQACMAIQEERIKEVFLHTGSNHTGYWCYQKIDFALIDCRKGYQEVSQCQIERDGN